MSLGTPADPQEGRFRSGCCQPEEQELGGWRAIPRIVQPSQPTLAPSHRALPSLAAQGKMNKMKNFKRRFSLSVPRTETIEESLTEFTEQFNQLNNRRNEGKKPPGPFRGAEGASGVSAASKASPLQPP